MGNIRVTTVSADSQAMPNRPASARRHRVAAAASIAVVALMTASCHSGSAAKAPAGTPTAATQAIGGPTAAAQRQCGAERSFQPTQSELPGFTQDAESLDMPWPFHAAAAFPDRIWQNYVCGEFGDFIANIALSGYAPGKFPTGGLPGQLVRQNPHRVLEIIETLYQFRSATVAAQFVAEQKPLKVLAGLALAQDDRELPVSPLPGSIVSTFYMDADIPTDESQITVVAPLGTWVVQLYVHGGTKLDWNDVQPYWTTIDSALKPLEGTGV
jgi:hypothetical protein